MIHVFVFRTFFIVIHLWSPICLSAGCHGCHGFSASILNDGIVTCVKMGTGGLGFEEPAGTQATSTGTHSPLPSKKQKSYSRQLLCHSATNSIASTLHSSQRQSSMWESLRQVGTSSPCLPRSSVRQSKSETLCVERLRLTGPKT